MGNKKRKTGPTLEEILERPWCYYCERDFDDLKILISHQRAKHFKCPRCSRRLNTAGGLSVHLHQVHKESLKEIENALPNRADPSLEIFGIEGIPEDIVSAHKARVTDAYFQSEEGQRAAANGQAAANSKRPKVEMETTEQLKARLEKHRAQKRLEKEQGFKDEGSPSEKSPVMIHTSPVPPSAAITTSATAIATAMPDLAAFPNSNPAIYSLPGSANSIQQNPYGAQSLGPPPTLPYLPQMYQLPTGPPSAMPTPRPPYPIRSPSTSTPVPSQSQPAIPGLPQRPSFNSPHLTKEQMAQMHSTGPNGQYTHSNVAGTNPVSTFPPPNAEITDSVDDLIWSVTHPADKNSVPDTNGLPAKVTHSSFDANNERSTAVHPQSDVQSNGSHALPGTAPIHGQVSSEVKKERKSKKGKESNSNSVLAYADNEVSPEEKLAKLSRYQPNWKQGNPPATVLGEAGDAVTGTTGETVRDPQD